MSFVKKITFSKPSYCKVCRKKVTEGIVMNGYEEYMNFVCNDCFKKYFRDTSKIEKSGISVGLRPADIHKNEYRMHYIVSSKIIKDILIWQIVCFSVFFLLKNILSMFYNGVSVISLPMMVIFSGMAIVSFMMSVITLKDFVSGLLRGMNHLRRILLFVKLVAFLFDVIFFINYIIKWR